MHLGVVRHNVDVSEHIQKDFLQVPGKTFETVFVKKMRNGDCQDAKELCFAQYIDVMSKEKLVVFNIDKILGFLPLRWHRMSSGASKFSAGKHYDLVPIEAILGTVNIVPRNKMFCVIDMPIPYAVSDSNICVGVDG